MTEEMTDVFNPDRLEVARMSRGLSVHDVAVATGISMRTLYNYRVGKTSPPKPVVGQLSIALNFPPAWFYGPSLDMPDPRSMSHYGT